MLNASARSTDFERYLPRKIDFRYKDRDNWGSTGYLVTRHSVRLNSIPISARI